MTNKDTKPERGYEIGNLVSSPEKIRITGPTSLINKIDKVTASVDVSGASSDVTRETDVTVIDKNGEQFSSQDMSYLNVSKVYVTARLWKVRTDVKISAECSGTPADGYQVEGVTTTPNVISVSGSDEALHALAEQNNTVWIPAEAIDISGRDKDCEDKINISDYLPEGSTVCEVPTKNIKVENVPDGMQVAFDAAQVELRVKKTKEDLGDLKEKNIKASIDLKDKKEGTYEVVVDIEIPEGYDLVVEVKTQIEVTRISKAEDNSLRGEGIMVSQKITINNPSGLHLRPAGNLCNEAIKYQSLITFTYEGATANAKSVLSVLGACVKCGDEIELVCKGADEEEAMKAMVKAISSGLGE